MEAVGLEPTCSLYLMMPCPVRLRACEGLGRAASGVIRQQERISISGELGKKISPHIMVAQPSRFLAV